MDAKDYRVTLPFGRMVNVAMRLGSQDSKECPLPNHVCFNQRGLRRFLNTEDEVETECTECWLHYFTTGK